MKNYSSSQKFYVKIIQNFGNHHQSTVLCFAFMFMSHFYLKLAQKDIWHFLTLHIIVLGFSQI